MNAEELKWELFEARKWIQSIESVIGENQRLRAFEEILKFEISGFPHRNWKKLLLESLANGNSLSLWGRETLFVNLNDARALIDELIVEDVYGLEALSEVNYVIDAGASNGLFSRLVLKKFPNARVNAVEPNPLNIKMIKGNLQKEIDSGQVTLSEGALNTSTHFSYLQLPNDENVWGGLGASLVKRERLYEREMHRMKVKSVSLESLIKGKVDLLKCDIEGAEFKVIRSAGDKIRQCKRLLIEIHADTVNFGKQFSKLISFLERNGFKVGCFEGAPSCAPMFDGRPSPSFMLFAIANE